MFQLNSGRSYKSISKTLMPMFILVLVAASFCLAFVPTSALAQSSPSAGTETVVVTAEKRTEDVNEVPLSVAVVSGDDLQTRGIGSLSDLASYVPGLDTSNSGSMGQNGIVIRGLSTGYNNSTAATLVATYIDDEPVGSEAAGARGGFFSLDLMPYDVDHLEVLKGPQGTLYGAGAMGGILKYTLKAPDLENYDFQAGSSIEHIDGSGSVGWSLRGAGNIPVISDEVGIRASGYYQDQAGYINNVGTGINDSNRQVTYGGRVSALWSVTDALKVQATVLFQSVKSDDDTAISVDEATLRPIYGFGEQFTNFPQPFKQQTQDYSVHVNWDLDFASFTSSTSYSLLKSTLSEDFSAASPSYLFGTPYTDALSSYTFTDSVAKFTEEARLASSSDQQLEWMVGGIFTEEKLKEFENWPAYTPSLTPLPQPYTNLLLGQNNYPPSYEEWAIFGNATYKVTDRFDVSGGVRYAEDWSNGCVAAEGGYFGGIPAACYSRPTESVVTWMANAKFQLDENAMVYTRVATGFRPGGGCDTCGTPSLGIPGVYGPDSLTDYEAGFKGHYLGNRLQLELSAYHIDWDNIQIQVLKDGFGYNGNGGTAVSQGVELAVSYEVIDGLRLGSSAAFSDAHLTQDAPGVGGLNGDPLPVAPKWSAAVTTDYTTEIDNDMALLIGAAYRFKGMSYNQFRSSPDPEPMGAQNLVDLYAGLQLKNVTIKLYGKNVFNDRSYTGLVYAVDPSRPLFVPVQPATVGISVDFKN